MDSLFYLYQTLNSEVLDEVYQRQFNMCIPYREAGFRSMLDMFNRGSVHCGVFGLHKDDEGQAYNYVLTSCNFMKNSTKISAVITRSTTNEQQFENTKLVDQYITEFSALYCLKFVSTISQKKQKEERTFHSLQMTYAYFAIPNPIKISYAKLTIYLKFLTVI